MDHAVSKNLRLGRYESNDGEFVAELKVNAFGLVTNYPELWEEER